MLVHWYVSILYSHIPMFLHFEFYYVTQLPLILWFHWFYQSCLLRTDFNPIQVPFQYLYYPAYKVRNIEVFLLYGVVFTRSCCRGPLLGVVLVDARKYEPLLLDICLPCDTYILGGFSQCFSGFFQLVLVFLGQMQ